MNSREILAKRLLNYWSYFKDKFKNNAIRIHAFSQTNLGATLTGAIAGSVLTYSFGYSKLTQEKDQAIEALTTERNTNAALAQQNINNQTVISSLTAQNAQLLDDKITINNNNFFTIKKHDKCVSDIRQIAVLHANSFFKPSIKPIIDDYSVSVGAEEVLDSRKTI